MRGVKQLVDSLTERMTMTDKQIIIDGIDVSGCPYYHGNDICKNTCHYFCSPCEWVDVQNCDYKQFNKLQAERDSYIDKYFLESQKVAKLSKTLKEIKEIIYFNKANRMAGGACISIDQILQKISEVEYE